MKKKKLLALALSVCLAGTSLLGGAPAGAAREDSAGKVMVQREGSSVTVGNGFISRAFSTENQKIRTTGILNRRTEGGDTAFLPGEASREFTISLIPSYSALDRGDWTATADSFENASGATDGPASNLIDGRMDSIWHTNYGGGQGPQAYPHSVTFDLKKAQSIRAFAYTPRQDSSQNGNISEYELYIADTEAGLENVSAMAVKGTFRYDARNPIYVNLPEAHTGRYVRLKALNAVNGLNFAGGAEFHLYDEPIPESAPLFSSQDLTLTETLERDAPAREDGKTGKMLTFVFAPYVCGGVEWTVRENIAMYDGEHFMRKFLEVSVPEADRDQARIDYIDLESLVVDPGYQQWTHPQMSEGVGGMSGYVIALGQPVYVQGMFFGCEFPMTETEITPDTHTAHMRYYSGKSFTELARDEQMTGNTYVTWPTVAGAARSTDMEVIQSDFFSYIDSISQKTDFRTQYNSWYDNMMRISETSIHDAFLRMEKGFTQSGVAPLDSYVVDDGWNNYNSTKYKTKDVEKSGNTDNQTGFWEFNDKFPNGFVPSSDLVHKFGTNFGVWLGPRGGYNFNATMGKIIQDAGKGAYNAASSDIDVGDRTYLKNLQTFFLEQQTRNKINYWKLDGFATQPCGDSSHNHAVGGKNGIYYFTDTWEGWTDVLEALRENAVENDISNLWLSLTCYVNPSPWYLQWANSIWMQNSQDMGRVNTGLTDQVDQLLTYRDGRYFDFVKVRAFQFPLAHIYNHDPVYGKEGTNLSGTMNDDQFRAYLYMMATRGTAFWELYYSPEMMDEGEKWEINADFLTWAKENFHILRNAKLFGATPDSSNAYGYSCWDGTDGIVSLRNPSTQVKTLTFPLDRTTGVREGASNLHRTTRMSYKTPEGADDGYRVVNYGDEISVTLQPGEARVWEFSEEQDTEPPVIEKTEAAAPRVITVTFSERVYPGNFSVSGNRVTETHLHADHRTVDLTLATPMESGEQLTVTASGVTDYAGNALDGDTAQISYYSGNLVAEHPDAMEQETSISTADVSVSGVHSFTVSAKASLSGENGAIVRQGGSGDGGYALCVNRDGRPGFVVDGVGVYAGEPLPAGQSVTLTGVRENNGMVKLYVDGALAGSAYDPAHSVPAVDAAEIFAGPQGGLSGKVQNVRVYNRGLGYDEIAGLAQSEGKIPAASLSVSATSSESGHEAAKAIDGSKDTYWTSDPAIDSTQTRQYLTIDLQGTYALDKLVYAGRYDAGEHLNCTGNILHYQVETSMDGIHWTPVADGDNPNTEREFEIPLEGSPVANYIRLTGTRTYHWQDENRDKCVTAAEVGLYGTPVIRENVALHKSAADVDRPDSDPARLSHATDGNKSAGNYLGFEGVSATIDLETQYNLDQINLFRYYADSRTYNGTVLVVHNGDPLTGTVVYNSDAENHFGFGAGTEPLYAETAAGKAVFFPKATGRYITVYMRGSTAGDSNHIVELEAYGEKAPDIEAPTAPGDLRASDVGTTSATLSWKASADNVGVARYLVKNGDQQIASVNADTRSCQVTGLSPETAYTLQVFAQDAAGNLSPASTVSFTTLAEAPEHVSVVFLQPENGAITASINDVAIETGSTVPLGSDIVFTFTPDRNYHVRSVWLNDTPVTLTEENTYTVQNVQQDLSVRALFEADAAPGEARLLHVQYGANAALDVTGETEIILDGNGIYAARVGGGAPVTLRFTPVSGTFAGAAVNGEPIDCTAQSCTYVLTMPEADKILRFTFTYVRKELLGTILTEAEKVTDEKLETLVPTVKKRFTAALEGARAVYADPDATQEEVDGAWSRLLNAMHYLSFEKGEKDALQKLIDIAETIDQESFTAESLKALETALDAARAVCADEDALKQEVIDAEAALDAAIRGLAYPADFTTLRALVDQAAGYDLDAYMQNDALTAFETILEDAKDLLNHADASQEAVDQMAKKLLDAMNALRRIPDREALKDLLKELEAIGPEGYTAASYAAFRLQLHLMRAVYEDENATDEQIAGACAMGEEAAELLRKVSAPSKPSRKASSTANRGNVYGAAGIVAAARNVASQTYVRSDTTAGFTLQRGEAYCFKMTVANGNGAAPSFTVGNGSVLKTQFVARFGNDYYYRVHAVGLAGQSTGVYTQLPNGTLQRHCVVTIA